MRIALCTTRDESDCWRNVRHLDCGLRRSDEAGASTIIDEAGASTISDEAGASTVIAAQAAIQTA